MFIVQLQWTRRRRRNWRHLRNRTASRLKSVSNNLKNCIQNTNRCLWKGKLFERRRRKFFVNLCQILIKLVIKELFFIFEEKWIFVFTALNFASHSMFICCNLHLTHFYLEFLLFQCFSNELWPLLTARWRTKVYAIILVKVPFISELCVLFVEVLWSYFQLRNERLLSKSYQEKKTTKKSENLIILSSLEYVLTPPQPPS